MADPAPSSSSEDINVKVKTMEPATYELKVSAQISVAQLKDRLVSMTEIPQDRQRIIYKGRVLENDQQLQARGVEEGHTLHLVERASNAPPPSAAHAPQHTGQHAGVFPIAMGSVELDSDETDVNTLLNSIFRQLGGQGQMQGSASGEGDNAADHQRTGQEAQFIAQQLMESLGGQIGQDPMQPPGSGPADARPNMLASIHLYLNRLQEIMQNPPVLLPSLSYPPGQDTERREQTRLMEAVRTIMTPAVRSNLTAEQQARLDAELARHPAAPSTGSSARSGAANQASALQTSTSAQPTPVSAAASASATAASSRQEASNQGEAATGPATASTNATQTQSASDPIRAAVAAPHSLSQAAHSASAQQDQPSSTAQTSSEANNRSTEGPRPNADRPRPNADGAGRHAEGQHRRRRATGAPAISPAVTMALGSLLLTAQEGAAWRDSAAVVQSAAQLLLQTDSFEGERQQLVLDNLRRAGSHLYRLAPVLLELARACSGAVAAVQGDAGPLALNTSQYIRHDGSRPAVGYTPSNVSQMISSMSIPLFPGMPMGAMPMGPDGHRPTVTGPTPSATGPTATTDASRGTTAPGSGTAPGNGPAPPAPGADRGGQPGQAMGINVGALLQSAFANAAANAGAQGNRPGVLAGETRQVIQVPGAPPVTIRFGARPTASQAHPPAAPQQGAANTPVSLQIGSGSPVDLSPVVQRLGSILGNAVQSAVTAAGSATGTAAASTVSAPSTAAPVAAASSTPAGSSPASNAAPANPPSAASLLNPPVMQQLMRALLHSLSPLINNQASQQPSGTAQTRPIGTTPAADQAGTSNGGASGRNAQATAGNSASTAPSAAADTGSASVAAASGQPGQSRTQQLSLSEPLEAVLGALNTSMSTAQDASNTFASAEATTSQQAAAESRHQPAPSHFPTAAAETDFDSPPGPSGEGSQAAKTAGRKARGLGSALPPRDKASKKSHSRASSPGASDVPSSSRQGQINRPAPAQAQRDNVKRARHGASPPQTTAAASDATAVAQPSSSITEPADALGSGEGVEEIAQPRRGSVQARSAGGLDEIMSSMFGGTRGGEGLNLSGLMQAAGQAMQDPQTSQRMARVFQGMSQGPSSHPGQGQSGPSPQSSPGDSAAGGGGLGALLGSMMQSLAVAPPGNTQGTSVQGRRGSHRSETSSSSDWRDALSELSEEDRAEWETTIRDDLARQAELANGRYKNHSAAYLAGRPPSTSSTLLPGDGSSADN